MQEKLQKVFGHSQFRGQQANIVQSALQGENSLVLMPTGMGKSLCYQLPALVRSELVLVISPLIALMQDQVEALRRKGVAATYINSSLTAEERQTRLRRLSEGEFLILYVTPERFRKTEFVEVILKRKIQLLAIDEAHCISQWGHDFRPDYSRLGEIRQLLGNPATMALTATATPAVQKDILQQLQIPEARVFVEGLERPNLSLNVHEVVGLDEKIRAIVGLTHQVPGAGIVYFTLIQTLEKVSNELGRLGIPHLVYHGSMQAQERRKSLQNFIRGESPLILATPAFGLGVDKEDVRLLVHAELPGSIEAYFQEVGRAGRDGRASFCHLLFDPDDVSIQMDFIKWSNPDTGFVETVYRLIEKNALRLEQEGFDFLREQMNFYNRRDFRAETAVNWLERWGCLQKTATSRFGFLPVEAPQLDTATAKKLSDRLQVQNQKLLDVVRLAQLASGCRMQVVLQYFGNPTAAVCGRCDLCGQVSR